MNKSFKIAIDISPLQDGNAIRGVGYYTKHLVESIQKEIKTNPKFKNWQIDLVTDPKLIKNNHYQLIHYPYFDPFFLTLPKKTKSVKRIITIHDLIPIQFAKHYPVGIKGRLKYLIQKNHAQQSDLIITISHYSKYIIHDYLKYPSDQIYVTYLAADKNFYPITNQKILQSVKQKYHLPDKFILYVGDINWNKNIPNLVKACHKAEIPLVIVGSAATQKNVPDHPWTKDLRWLQSQPHTQLNSSSTHQNTNTPEYQRTSELILTGFVPDDELNSIFNLAFAYCQPSFAEGFGLPLVQAMNTNCPVIYAHTTSMPEIMEEQPLSFNPNSVDELVNIIKKLENDKQLRDNIIKTNQKRSLFFDWKFTAQQTLAVYELALNG